MSYVETFTRILSILNKYKVEYMIIGGTAVGLYGYIRNSTAKNGDEVDEPDLDIWYNPNIFNYYPLLNALEEIGFDVKRHKAEQAPNPKESVFRYTLEDCTLDIIPSIKLGIKFIEANKRCKKINMFGVETSVISLVDLIDDKVSLGRPKDLRDADELRALDNPTDSE